LTTATQPKPVLLKRVIATLGELPVSQVGVVSTVLRMTADINTEVYKLSHVLSADQALTARVLRMSNSPFYGRMRGVGSLNEAIMILGFYTIRSLVVATSTHAMFKRDHSEWEKDLWNHSLSVALGARIVARRVDSRTVEEAFLAGLMHDIAILILLQRFPEEYKPVIAEAQLGHETLMDIERRLLGFTHAELGAIILEQWNLPSFLVEVTRFHHDPEASAQEAGSIGGKDGVTRTAHIVHFADEMAKSLGYGFQESPSGNLADLSSASALALTPDTIAQVAEDLSIRFTEESKLFEE